MEEQETTPAYEAPSLVEVGDFTDLTLGPIGFWPDMDGQFVP
ncbi:lasso RiPP family leader peptide-containing protein [Streptomyces sp. NPDC048172]